MKKRFTSWFQMYYQPRIRIREVLENRPGNRIYLFMGLVGFVLMLQAFDLVNGADNSSIGILLSKSLIIGTVLGFIGSTLLMGGTFLASKLLRGNAEYERISSVVGRGLFLVVPAFLFWMIEFAWLDGACFLSSESAGAGGVILMVLKYACLLGIPIYTVLFLVELTGFSLGKSILTYLLGILFGAAIGGVIYMVLTLLANFVMVLNDPRYTFFFLFLS